MRKKKVNWKPNDVFAIPLLNGNYAVGHILDQRLVNTVRIALYDEILKDPDDVEQLNLVKDYNLISLVEVTREQLDYGVWKIIGNKQTFIPITEFPNEQFRTNKWINSLVHDASIIESFMNAYYSLLPWDKYYDPNYFDKLLVNPSKKPNNLLYKKQ